MPPIFATPHLFLASERSSLWELETDSVKDVAATWIVEDVLAAGGVTNIAAAGVVAAASRVEDVAAADSVNEVVAACSVTDVAAASSVEDVASADRVKDVVSACSVTVVAAADSVNDVVEAVALFERTPKEPLSSEASSMEDSVALMFLHTFKMSRSHLNRMLGELGRLSGGRSEELVREAIS